MPHEKKVCFNPKCFQIGNMIHQTRLNSQAVICNLKDGFEKDPLNRN